MAPGISKRRSTQKSRTEGGGGFIGVKLMELVLSDGFDHAYTGKQVSIHTGDLTKFKDFEELFNAFAEQWKYASHLNFRMRDVTRWAEKNWMESPFLAVMDDYCVEEGKGAFDNMQWPNAWSDILGVAGCVDDLAAIKYWIFDKKKYTMEDLVKAVRANWEGYEGMRQDMLAAPKSVSLFSSLAPMVGAEPFGKRAGEVLHEGGSSPYVGMDRKGPTAVLKTMSKIPQDGCKGIQLNQRLPVGMMRESEKGFDIWSAYMKTWHDLNIDHVQFNVVRSEDMRAAQQEPEKWQHLIVRIAGYSARFLTLPKNAQDAIIARTEQEIG